MDDNNDMNVAETDVVVAGILDDELSRCKEALGALNKALSGLSKGSLQMRIKRHGESEYRYHYLVFRDGHRVVNQHVPEDSVKELQDKLALRRKYVLEAKVYTRRISYLQRILGRKVKGNGKLAPLVRENGFGEQGGEGS
jgi:hypothetical protein